MGLYLQSVLASALDGREELTSHSGRLIPEEWTNIHWTGGLIGRSFGLGVVAKRQILPCRESNAGLPTRSLATVLVSTQETLSELHRMTVRSLPKSLQWLSIYRSWETTDDGADSHNQLIDCSRFCDATPTHSRTSVRGDTPDSSLTFRGYSQSL